MSTPKPHICACPGCRVLTLGLLCHRHRLVPDLGRVDEARHTLARVLTARRRIFNLTTPENRDATKDPQ